MNKSFLKTISIVIFSGSMVGPAAAAVISDFSSGAEGFTANGFDLTHFSSGRGTGGYIEVFDSRWGNGVLQLDGATIGSLAPGGSISFDAMVTSSHNSTHRRFGEMTLRGGGFSATLDNIHSVPPNGSWEHFSVDLDAASWGLSEVNFSSLLSNLSSFSMILETKNGLNERVAFDNFAFESGNTSVPVPGAAVLIAPALATLLLRRRRPAMA